MTVRAATDIQHTKHEKITTPIARKTDYGPVSYTGAITGRGKCVDAGGCSNSGLVNGIALEYHADPAIFIGQYWYAIMNINNSYEYADSDEGRYWQRLIDDAFANYPY